jgi:hypothetical protein
LAEAHAFFFVFIGSNPPPLQLGYTVKKACNFPVPVGMSLTKLILDGNNLIIPVLGEFGYWLVTSRLGTRKLLTFFTVFALAYQLQREKKEKDNEGEHAGWGT